MKGNGSIKGWLVAKKSQAQIARDKKKATEEMKRKRAANRAKPAKGKTKKGGTNSRGSRRKKYEEDSDFSGDDDENGFIVGDDFIDDNDEDEDKEILEIEESESEAFDSELEEEEEDDEEEDMVLHDDEDSDDGIEHDDNNNNDNSRNEEEAVNPIASSRSSRAAARNPRRGKKTNVPSTNFDNDDDSNSDSDEEPDSFLPTGSTRKSAPSKLLRQNAEAAKKRFNPSLETTLRKQSIDKKKRKIATGSSLMNLKAPALKKSRPQSQSKLKSSVIAGRENSEDDEDLTSPCYTPNKAPAKQSKGRGNSKLSKPPYEEILSSDDDNEENTINYSTASTTNDKKPRGSIPASENTSGYFNRLQQKHAQNRQKTIVLDDSDSDSDSDNRYNDSKRNKPNFSNKYDSTSISLEDTPDNSNQDRRRRLNKKVGKIGIANKNGVSKSKVSRTTYNLDDSSDEDDAVRFGSSGGKTNTGDDDIFMEEEEDLKVAMKLSLMESKKQKAKDQKKKSETTNNNIETILDDSSDEEDEDQGDEYYDEEKETASIVLRSAEQLSGHVVRAMSGWFKGAKNGGTVQGIIVDGAISLGNLDESESNSGGFSSSSQSSDGDSNGGTHEWISKAVMAKAIPNVTLSGYQLIGVNWMALLNGMTCEVGTKGTKNVNGVLADEMGLGKTVQTIAFLAWLKYRRQTKVLDLESSGGNDGSEEKPPLPHLIVVPVSTLPNWIREFEKFCPEMRVVKYHGSQQHREAMKEDLREHLPKNYNKHVLRRTKLDVIVAPVSYFQKENSPDRKFLSNFKYDYLVVDEAHNLKNAKSTRYKMLDKVKTEHRLLLTGTPVQNNPQELLNMLSFIMPLFSKAGSPFEENDNHTEQMLKHFVDESAENGDEHTAYKKLKQLFAPFVLRRRKDDVIAQLLPPKKRNTIFVELSESTRSIYKDILRSHFDKNGSTISPGTGEHLFTNLRKCAHHPLLLRTRWNTPMEKERLIDDFYRFQAFKGEGCNKQRVAEEMASWNDFEIHLTALDLIDENEHRREALQRYVLEEKDLFCSSKFESLRDLLPKLISESHRILIFSSWTSCLDLLGCLMQHLGIVFQRMDGSCPSDERQRLIDQFNTDTSYSVFLLSTKACGLGINLTSADTCIIHDLDFNPFNDLQAEDRCHRIGQKKPVTVYKLISRDTVDEDIYKMQEKKAKMNAAIMDSSSSKKEKSAILTSVLEKAEQEQGKVNESNIDDEEVVI